MKLHQVHEQRHQSDQEPHTLPEETHHSLQPVGHPLTYTMQLVVVLGTLEPFQGHRLGLLVTVPLDICTQPLPEAQMDDVASPPDHRLKHP